jgi:hypothetical protein
LGCGGWGGHLFCGFKILAILQNLLPFCFVEFTLEKKKKKRKFTKKFKVFFMSPKGQNGYIFESKYNYGPKKKKKKKKNCFGSFFYFRVFWGYLSFPKNREILPEHSFLFFKIKEVFPQKNGEN